MGRLATVLCTVTGIVTIIDHCRNTPFYAQLLSRHVTAAPGGYQISPGLNFFVTLALGAGVWWMTSPDPPLEDLPAARKQRWKRAYLAAAAIAFWLILGPAIRPAQTTPSSPKAAAAAPPPRRSPFSLKPLFRQSSGQAWE